jgi:pseudouridine kinase
MEKSLLNNTHLVSEQCLRDFFHINEVSLLNKKEELAFNNPVTNQIIAIGGANVDRKFSIEGEAKLGTSNPAKVSESVGGVARNIAENLGRLGNRIALITTIGNDYDSVLIEQFSKNYMCLDLIKKMENEKTGSYSAILDQFGELIIAMANMAIYKQLSPELLKTHAYILQQAKCILIDLNCPVETVEYAKNFASLYSIPFVIIPVSSPKMVNMPSELDGVSYLICNRDEAGTYLNMELNCFSQYEKAIKKLQMKGAKTVLLTLGENGVMVGHDGQLKHYKAVRASHIIDVTGTGDAFVSAFLHGVLNNHTLEQAVKFGLVSSSKTLQSDNTVRQDLTVENLLSWMEIE